MNWTEYRDEHGHWFDNATHIIWHYWNCEYHLWQKVPSKMVGIYPCLDDAKGAA